KRSRPRKPKEDRKNLRLWAEGARETILAPHLDAYQIAIDQGRRQERKFLKKVCREFHARVNWRTKDHEEPVLNAWDDSTVVEEELLSEEEEQARSTRVNELNARIRRWFTYRLKKLRKRQRSGKELDPRKDPYSVLLATLSGVTSPPKALQAYQQFMRESYEEKVAPVVAERWQQERSESSIVSARTKEPKAGFRAEVARQVFADLPADERKAIGERAKSEAAQAKDEYVATLKAPPSTTPEARQLCIDNVSDFIAPILQGLYSHTGLHATLIMGGPIPEFGGEIRTLHVSYGRNRTVQGPHWPQWDKARFAGVTQFMTEYLHTAYTPQECAQSALLRPPELSGANYTIPPDDSDSDSGSDSSDSDDDSDDTDSDDEDRRPAKKRKLAASKRAGKTKETSAYTIGLSLNIERNKALIARLNSGDFDPLDPQFADIHREVEGLMAELRKYVKQPEQSSQASSQAPFVPPLAPPSSQPPLVPPPHSSESPTPPSFQPPVVPPLAPPSSQPPLVPPPPSSQPPVAPSPTPPSSQPPLAPPPPSYQPPVVHARSRPSSTTEGRRKSTRSTRRSASQSTAADTPLLPIENVLHSTSPPSSLAATSQAASVPNLPDNDNSDESDGANSVAQALPVSLPPVSQAAQAGLATLPPPPRPSDLFTSAPCPANAKAWFVDAHQAMTQVDLGCHYVALVAAWTRMEAASRFEHSPTNLPAKFRPKPVGTWISNSRRGPLPTVKDPVRYAKEWQIWWDSLQPAWRARESTGEWSVTRGYGQNGREWGALYHWG
ncbi:hypothetical protein R3P38DRAFT_2432805, partial [Favolaschia claudopus]